MRSPERQEFLNDIVICVVEDYGSNPWRQVRDYDPDEPSAIIMELNDFDEVEAEHQLNREVIAKGLGKIADPAFNINSEMRGNIVGGSAENDAGNIDAYDADAILQAAIFGELVYG